MMYRVRHSTVYTYDDTVAICQNEAHLRPRNAEHQKCLSTKLDVQPTAATLIERVDYFGNPTTFFTVQDGHRRLAVTSESVVTVAETAMPSPQDGGPWENTPQALRMRLDDPYLDARLFTFPSAHISNSDELAAYARPSFPQGRRQLEAVLDLMHRIYTEFKYDPKATCITTSPEQVLRLRRGVCQDFAHLMIGCLRTLGLPARYVSGYLATMPPPGKQRLVGADVSHAWVAVFFPEAGWIDFDPTNDVVPTTQHVTLGWGRDYADVCPIKGVFVGGGRHHMSVSVDVEPI